MAARRLVVHVGPRKTGSTSIQHMLAARRGWLREHGVHVAVPGGIVDKLQLRNAGDAGDREWGRLAREIAEVEAPCCVVSSEGLANPHFRGPCAHRLAALADRADLDIEVVGYVRPQWQLLESEYAQQVTGGRIGAPFARFVDKALDADEGSIVDYRAVFEPFRAQFGDRVNVTPLEASRLPDGLLAHFLALCGTDAGAADVADFGRANPRQGAKHVEVCRLVIWAHLDALRRDGRRWPPRLPRKGLRGLLDDDTPFSGFDLAGIRRVEAIFASANAAFARDYGIDAHGTLFQEGVRGEGRRANMARWEDFSPAEQRRVRRYVRRRTGVDLDRVRTVREPRRRTGLDAAIAGGTGEPGAAQGVRHAQPRPRTGIVTPQMREATCAPACRATNRTGGSARDYGTVRRARLRNRIRRARRRRPSAWLVDLRAWVRRAMREAGHTRNPRSLAVFCRRFLHRLAHRR